MIKRPILGALPFVRGSLTLIMVRLLLSALVVLLAASSLGGTFQWEARQVFYAGAALPLNGNILMDLLEESRRGILLTLGPVVLVLIMFKLLMDGTALRLFTVTAPGLEQPDGGLWRRTFSPGNGYFFGVLLIPLLCASLFLTGAGAVTTLLLAANYLTVTEVPEGRTLYQSMVEGPALAAFAIFFWSRITGAVSLHARAALAVDDRARLLPALAEGIKTVCVRPAQATLVYIVLSLLTAVLGAALLVYWRASDPRGDLLVNLIALWVLVMVLQAFIWHWLTRSATLLAVERTGYRVRNDTVSL